VSVGWRIFDQKCGTCHCFGRKTCATGPRAGRSRLRILAGAEGIFVHSDTSGPALGPTQPPVQWVSAFFPRDKTRPGSEVYNSPSSNSDVTNEWSYTSSAPIRLHGLETDGFIFTLNLQLPRCQNLKSPIFSLVLVYIRWITAVSVG